ncbi:MAG: hypothetical protein AVDCRST_MAG49-2840 [uncultured Thermomicrobiales bacterium]|uniref:Uncharacterized protein n=1 Tax=uncultured Thermomicrobiales bacterium TaxID=1645740 RepID=A0A6J4V4D7_9BACT|nr:MAG: hypothetical protein AVDCRST_MAG49-2840 [uncultured Thermomicrobiales bacterium]
MVEPVDEPVQCAGRRGRFGLSDEGEGGPSSPAATIDESSPSTRRRISRLLARALAPTRLLAREAGSAEHDRGGAQWPHVAAQVDTYDHCEGRGYIRPRASALTGGGAIGWRPTPSPPPP